MYAPERCINGNSRTDTHSPELEVHSSLSAYSNELLRMLLGRTAPNCVIYWRISWHDFWQYSPLESCWPSRLDYRATTNLAPFDTNKTCPLVSDLIDYYVHCNNVRNCPTGSNVSFLGSNLDQETDTLGEFPKREQYLFNRKACSNLSNWITLTDIFIFTLNGNIFHNKTSMSGTASNWSKSLSFYLQRMWR